MSRVDKHQPYSQKELGRWSLKYHPRSSEEELKDHFKGKIIVLAGVPGVGKSSLGEQLATLLDGSYFAEYVQPQLLNAYLNIDRKKYAFAYQVLMIRERIHIYRKAIEEAQRGKACIIDGPLACDNAFARILWKDGLIDDQEYEIYQKICDESLAERGSLGVSLYRPDYMVYLDCSEAVALARIKKREEKNAQRYGESEAYRKGRFLFRLRSVFAEVLEGETCLVFNYNEDSTDSQGKIPRARLVELLGLIRDRKFQQHGIGKGLD